MKKKVNCVKGYRNCNSRTINLVCLSLENEKASPKSYTIICTKLNVHNNETPDEMNMLPNGTGKVQFTCRMSFRRTLIIRAIMKNITAVIADTH